MDLLASLYIFFAFPSVVWEDLFIALLIGNLLGLAINRTTKWIRVEYTDAGEKKQLAYFADGSLLGWSGIFGGTKILFKKLKGE